MNQTSLLATFRGERHAEGASLARSLAPPYDVINPAQRAKLAGHDPANTVHVG